MVLFMWCLGLIFLMHSTKLNSLAPKSCEFLSVKKRREQFLSSSKTDAYLLKRRQEISDEFQDLLPKRAVYLSSLEDSLNSSPPQLDKRQERMSELQDLLQKREESLSLLENLPNSSSSRQKPLLDERRLKSEALKSHFRDLSLLLKEIYKNTPILKPYLAIYSGDSLELMTPESCHLLVQHLCEVLNKVLQEDESIKVEIQKSKDFSLVERLDSIFEGQRSVQVIQKDIDRANQLLGLFSSLENKLLCVKRKSHLISIDFIYQLQSYVGSLNQFREELNLFVSQFSSQVAQLQDSNKTLLSQQEEFITFLDSIAGIKEKIDMLESDGQESLTSLVHILSKLKTIFDDTISFPIEDIKKSDLSVIQSTFDEIVNQFNVCYETLLKLKSIVEGMTFVNSFNLKLDVDRFVVLINGYLRKYNRYKTHINNSFVSLSNDIQCQKCILKKEIDCLLKEKNTSRLSQKVIEDSRQKSLNEGTVATQGLSKSSSNSSFSISQMKRYYFELQKTIRDQRKVALVDISFIKQEKDAQKNEMKNMIDYVVELNEILLESLNRRHRAKKCLEVMRYKDSSESQLSELKQLYLRPLNQSQMSHQLDDSLKENQVVKQTPSPTLLSQSQKAFDDISKKVDSLQKYHETTQKQNLGFQFNSLGDFWMPFQSYLDGIGKYLGQIQNRIQLDAKEMRTIQKFFVQDLNLLEKQLLQMCSALNSYMMSDNVVLLCLSKELEVCQALIARLAVFDQSTGTLDVVDPLKSQPKLLDFSEEKNEGRISVNSDSLKTVLGAPDSLAMRCYKLTQTHLRLNQGPDMIHAHILSLLLVLENKIQKMARCFDLCLYYHTPVPPEILKREDRWNFFQRLKEVYQQVRQSQYEEKFSVDNLEDKIKEFEVKFFQRSCLYSKLTGNSIYLGELKKTASVDSQMSDLDLETLDKFTQEEIEEKKDILALYRSICTLAKNAGVSIEGIQMKTFSLSVLYNQIKQLSKVNKLVQKEISRRSVRANLFLPIVEKGQRHFYSLREKVSPFLLEFFNLNAFEFRLSMFELHWKELLDFQNKWKKLIQENQLSLNESVLTKIPLRKRVLVRTGLHVFA